MTTRLSCSTHLGLAAIVFLVCDTSLFAQSKPKPPANRLANETSPYLLLHAHNPVDWYPWGPEAFAKAKAEGKPIFLSVGYSAATGATSWSGNAS